MSMAAFLVSLVAAGWTPGDSFPTGNALTAASGAAFMAVVFAQAGNAFACRSTTTWPGALGWTSNRLLVPAVGIGLVFAFAALLVDPLAHQLEQSVPPLAGWLVVVASPIILLAADAGDKLRRQRAWRRASPHANDGPPPLVERCDRGDHRTARPQPAVSIDRGRLTEEERYDEHRKPTTDRPGHIEPVSTQGVAATLAEDAVRR
jgi:hypothetical protein